MSNNFENLNVTTLSRPIRHAFILELDNLDFLEIDKILKISSTFWGGRFSPIIPVKKDASIDKFHWNFLVGNDPDIIITNFTLSDTLVEQINRSILPIKIIETKWNNSDKSWSPSWDWEGISTAQFPELLRGENIIGRPREHLLIEKNGLEGDRYQFLLQNFGITSEESLSKNHYWQGIPITKIKAEDTIGILSVITKTNGGIYTPISYSEVFANPHFNNDYCKSTHEFQLVVGDTSVDRLYAWNRKLLGRMNCSGITTIWIPPSLCEDNEIVENLIQLIKRKFNGYNNSNQAYVVSHSLSEEALSKIAEAFQKGLSISLHSRKLLENSLPKGKPGPLTSFGKIEYQSKSSSTIGFTEEKAILSTPRPNFIPEKMLEHGCWMGQFGIQYHPDRSIYMNVRPAWSLPKKIGLADRFFENRIARTDCNDWLATIIKGKENSICIKIPDDQEILIGTAWSTRFNQESKSQEIPQIPYYLNFPVSEEGKSINGVVKLFGNLQQFDYAFRDVFWREVFFEMAKRPESGLKNRTESISKQLGEFLDKQNNVIPPKDSPEIIELATSIAKSIRPSSKNQRFMTSNELRDIFNILKNKPEYREEFTNRGDFNDEIWGDIKKLRSFVHQGIIFQGCLLTCRYCKTETWFDVDFIKSKFQCEGCLSDNHFPINPPWHYRLNPFLINLIQEQGGYSVARTLVQLQSFCNDMFFFMPPFDVCSDDDHAKLTDIDIYVIKKDKLILGDVKSTPTGFLDTKTGELKNLTTLRTVIDIFKPNEFVFASECEIFPPHVLEKIKKFGEELQSMDIKVHEMCLSWP